MCTSRAEFDVVRSSPPFLHHRAVLESLATGRANAGSLAQQVDQGGLPFACLKQVDVNLTSPPLAPSCVDATRGITSAFTNSLFTIDDLYPDRPDR